MPRLPRMRGRVVNGRVCAVEACGKPLTRNPGERPSRFAARDYCDRVCYQVLRAAGLKPTGTVAAAQFPRRVCAFEPCSQPLVRRPGERTDKFRKRNTCDAVCANRRAHGCTTLIPADRVCEECGGPIPRRDGEAPSKWAARRFCTKSCASKASWTGDLKPPRAPKPVVEVLQEKPCQGCQAVMVWDREATTRSGWRRRRFCSRRCARSARTPARSRKAKPAPAPVMPPTVPAPAPAKPVWRPAGLSRIPNQWSGHRPPEEEAS